MYAQWRFQLISILATLIKLVWQVWITRCMTTPTIINSLGIFQNHTHFNCIYMLDFCTGHMTFTCITHDIVFHSFYHKKKTIFWAVEVNVSLKTSHLYLHQFILYKTKYNMYNNILERFKIYCHNNNDSYNILT